jgi:hypothetical protein
VTKKWLRGLIMERIIGRGERIRTSGLLDPNHEPTSYLELSSRHSSYSLLRLVASYQTLRSPCREAASNSAHHFYAGGGHKTGTVRLRKARVEKLPRSSDRISRCDNDGG